jgi:hypothetical protein
VDAQRKHFLEAADEMRRAMSTFLDEWEIILRDQPQLLDTIDKDYPFGKDFMELVGEVHGWYHSMKKGLKKSPLDWSPREPRDE